MLVTSGMKVVLNGGQAYGGLNGFSIGEEVIPLYYQRDRDGLPRGWIRRMKRTIRTLGWRFNADRMVMDYTLKCYVPAAGGTSSDMTPTLSS